MSEGPIRPKIRRSAVVWIVVAFLVGGGMVFVASTIEAGIHERIRARESSLNPHRPIEDGFADDLEGSGCELVKHLGAGFIVAAVVAFLFHVREFSEFFEELASGVLVKFDFLRGLDETTLSTLRRRTAAVHVEKFVAPNHPSYQGQEVVNALAAAETLLPSRVYASGIYRRDFEDTIRITKRTHSYVARALQIAPGAIAQEDYLEVEQRFGYKAVAPGIRRHILPDLGYNHYPVPYSVSIAPLHFTSAASRDDRERALKGQARFLTDGLKEIRLEITKSNNGEMSYRPRKGEPLLSVPFVKGVAQIAYRCLSFRRLKSESFAFNSMSVPTLGVTVEANFYGFARPVRAGVRLFKLGPTDKEPNVQDNYLKIECGGWFLEEHGYFFWWEE